MNVVFARLLHTAIAIACWLPVAGPALAQADKYPSRTVAFVLPASAGGASDTIARTMAQKLSEIWGSPVIVENKPGGGGAIATEYVARSKPDGYTLLSGFSEHSWMQYFSPKPSFDMNRDFAPIMLIGVVPNVIAINSSIKANNTAELVALLKAQPGKFNFGSGGVGSTLHLFGELFKKQQGVDMVHVPYKGANEANLAMISGQIEMVFPTQLSVRPHVAAGKVRVLAASSDERLALYPDVPTVSEVGMPDFRISIWYCLFAPANTPKDIVAKIHAGLLKAGNSPDVREKLNSIGVKLVLSTPEEFGTFFRSEQKRWGDVIESAKIKFE
jgi:tripartite-type tricarboxylate transporter receptor subunit TctC